MKRMLLGVLMLLGMINVTFASAERLTSTDKTKLLVENLVPPVMPLTLSLESADANVGEEVCLKVLPTNFDNILGMQFSIAYDASVLQFTTIKNPQSNLRIDTDFLEDNFGLPGVGSVPTGRITFVWDAPGARAVSIDDNVPLYEICFTVNADAATEVGFSATPTDIQFVDQNEQPVAFETTSAMVNESSGGGNPSNGFDSFTLDILDGNGNPGQQICLPIEAHKFTDVLGMQFTIDYNPTILAYSTMQNFDSQLRVDEDFLEDNFGLPGNGNVPVGKITFVWDAPGARAVSLNDGDVMFEVCFTVQSATPTVVSFSDAPTPVQFVDNNEQAIAFSTDPGNVNGSTSSTAPDANFSASSTTVQAGSTVQFADLSSNTPTSWSWTFEGGSPSNSAAQNPSVTFSTPGTYSVTLTATNANGSDTETKTGYIIVTDGAPNFDSFTLDITDGFGDVGSEVCLQINAYKFTDVLGMQFTIDYDPSILSYSSLKNFESQLRIDTDFLEDNFGLPGTGSVPAGKITFVWDAPGARAISVDDATTLFEVCFDVLATDETDVTFSNTPTDIQFVDVNEQAIVFDTDPGKVNGADPNVLNANFTASSTTIRVGESINFTDLSTGNPTSWSWTFSGGTPASSTAQNPTVTYNAEGVFAVTLVATNADGSDTETKVGYITVSDDQFDTFTFDITDGSGDIGEVVCVSVNAYKSPDLLGMQFTIDYDASKITFNRLENFYSELRIDTEFLEDNFGIPGNGQVPAGKLTFVWDAPGARAIDVPDGQKLFDICFTVNSTDKADITFSNNPTVIQIIDENEQIIPFNGDPGSINGIQAPTIVSPASITDVICAGESTGSIDLTVQGGTGSFTYLWSFESRTTEDLTNVPAGNYTVTVTDVNSGLFSTAAFTISEPGAALTISAMDVTDISCFGETDGAINITANGGVGGLVYTWNNGITGNDNVTGLAAATNYQVTITDQNGCTASSGPITISEPAALEANDLQITDVSCFGAADGQIQVNMTGGTPGDAGYAFSWNQSLPNTASQTDLAPGNYRFTVTDTRNCTFNSEVINISQPAQIIVSSFNATKISNGSNGSVNVSLTGGNGDFTFSWTGPDNFSSTENNLSGLSVPGEYCFTAMDARGCTINDCIQVLEKLNILDQVITPSCFGESNGAVTVNISGGTPEYSFQWSTGATGATLENVPAGNYSLTVTDGDNDNAVASIEIPAYDEIGIVAEIGEVTMAGNGMDGSVQLTINGGQSPYEFNWDNGAMTRDITGLSMGTYCVTVTDQRGCTSDICVDVLREAAPLSTNAQVDRAACSGEANGQVTINIVGGYAPYRIEFGDNEVIENVMENKVTRDDLPGGQMLFTIIDSRNSVVTSEFMIEEPDPIQITEVDLLHDTEASTCDGTIVLTIEGGTPGYSVSWNNNAFGTQLLNLCEIEGGYIPTVTDANGCMKTFDPINLNTFSVNGTPTPVECPMDDNGGVMLEVSGGEMPFTYEWSDTDNNIVSNQQNLTQVVPGTYSLRISEGSGNTISKVFEVTATSTLDLEVVTLSNFNGFAVSCDEAMNGMVRAIGSNGNNLTYEWTKDNVLVGMEETLTNAGIGLYQATVIDEAGCMVTEEVELLAPPSIEISGLVKDVSCPGEDDGEIIAEVVGGVQTSPFNYIWSNGTSGQRIAFLEQGTYTVTATDGNGCTAIQAFDIQSPDTLSVILETQAATERNSDVCNGAIKAVVSGGTPPYNYDWKQQPSETGSMIANECPGAFVVVVTDSEGCASSEASGVIENRLFPCLEDRQVITPDGDGLNDTFVLFCSGDLVDNHLEVFNRWGQLVYEIENYDCAAEGGLNCWEGETLTGEALPEGPYYYVLEFRDVEGELVQKRGSISLIRE